jgi:hypothetical protein
MISVNDRVSKTLESHASNTTFIPNRVSKNTESHASNTTFIPESRPVESPSEESDVEMTNVHRVSEIPNSQPAEPSKSLDSQQAEQSDVQNGNDEFGEKHQDSGADVSLDVGVSSPDRRSTRTADDEPGNNSPGEQQTSPLKEHDDGHTDTVDEETLSENARILLEIGAENEAVPLVNAKNPVTPEIFSKENKMESIDAENEALLSENDKSPVPAEKYYKEKEMESIEAEDQALLSENDKVSSEIDVENDTILSENYKSPVPLEKYSTVNEMELTDAKSPASDVMTPIISEGDSGILIEKELESMETNSNREENNESEPIDVVGEDISENHVTTSS